LSRELFTAPEFVGITFNSTNHTLKAEKLLLEEGINLIVIPTPREISTSCGLTIKLFQDDLLKSLKILRDSHVDIANTYLIRKEGKKNLVMIMENPC
jgi:hypothetical protein